MEAESILAVALGLYCAVAAAFLVLIIAFRETPRTAPLWRLVLVSCFWAPYLMLIGLGEVVATLYPSLVAPAPKVRDGG